MEKKWYRAPFIKGVLVVLAHIAVVASLMGFTWVILCAGVNYVNPTAKIPEDYAQTKQFGKNMNNALYEMSWNLFSLNGIEKDGKLNEEMLIDLEKYYNSGEVSAKEGEGNGFVYKLSDLINAEDDSEENREIVVCQKTDGSYAYEEWGSIQGKLLSGELVFAELADQEGSETESGYDLDDFLYMLEDRYNGYEYNEYFGICNKEGTLIYTDCWRMPISSMINMMLETKTAEGKDVLKLVNENAYWNGRLQEMENMFGHARSSLRDRIDRYKEYQELWSEGKTNLTFILLDEENKKVYTNDSKYENYEAASKNYKELMKNSAGRENAYINMRPAEGEVEVQQIAGWKASEWQSLCDHIEGTVGTEKIHIVAAVDLDYPVTDRFQFIDGTYDKVQPYLHNLILLAWGGVVVFLISIIWLTAVSGRSNAQDGVKTNIVDRLFTEIPVGVLLGGIFMMVGGVSVSYGEWYNNYGRWIIDNTSFTAQEFVPSPSIGAAEVSLIVLMTLGGAVCFFYGYLSSVRKLKAGTFFNGFGIWKIGRWCIRVTVKLFRITVKGLREFWRHKNLMTKVILIFIGLTLLHLFGGISAFFAFCSVVVDAILFIVLVKYAIDKQKVMDGIKEITAGHVEYKIPTEGLKGDNKEMAESINAIGEGLQNAVEESLKSERLKTDLITNVSHDIKTPLTSIINYVDLLKRENIEDPKIKGYIEVLEAKAQRLKILTEDVVEASKISSGNIKLEMMDLNFVEIILQTAGEFSEKFEARDLKLISNLPERPVVIHADGRRMWRVLANIYNNAAKYAMEHTRIYADLEENENEVAFSLKNISEQALNISADELTERFIRGDISRSTEGSGLGLSIAKNLTQKMGGDFRIYLDGDLFKVTLVFPKVKKEKKEEYTEKQTRENA